MVAQLDSSLLTVSVTSLIIPAIFQIYLDDKLTPSTRASVLLRLSHGSAIVLILTYSAHLIFQFCSHNPWFLNGVQLSLWQNSGYGSGSAKSLASRGSNLSDPTLQERNRSRPSPSLPMLSMPNGTLKMNIPSTITLLATVTVLAYATAENLVKSLKGMIHNHPGISKEWFTLIIIPVISNARIGNLELVMRAAVGSCINTAFFIIPFWVLIAWGMGKPLILLFDPLKTILLFFSVLVAKFSIEDGRNHQLRRLALILVYVLIALSFWNFPDLIQLVCGQPLFCPN
ncbi:hypothetical protein EST38_g13421 [Candolleomyces aberdarensis]|uniref:Sodium/calcium exchanger membrane region domain-containing protein n=1 Tax=Candolleomyces aberdarensis TaxID=2316362 RepID=A0A4Q2D111_9AGAR|nr:hypothetical protein EST38_g13421 [Candolleomyces aberdarensis]